MRITEIITEAFSQPYALDWEESEYGDIDAYTKLPDGTQLSIMFNKDNDTDSWMVEFYRGNSQEVTGEGDAYKIFATVLEAIKEFISKKDPEFIRFSATKDVEPGQNAQSRSKLYTTMVKRYANSLGYSVEISDQGSTTIYELSKIY